jgi:hypothetical protein
MTSTEKESNPRGKGLGNLGQGEKKAIKTRSNENEKNHAGRAKCIGEAFDKGRTQFPDLLPSHEHHHEGEEGPCRRRFRWGEPTHVETTDNDKEQQAYPPSAF